MKGFQVLTVLMQKLSMQLRDQTPASCLSTTFCLMSKQKVFNTLCFYTLLFFLFFNLNIVNNPEKELFMSSPFSLFKSSSNERKKEVNVCRLFPRNFPWGPWSNPWFHRQHNARGSSGGPFSINKYFPTLLFANNVKQREKFMRRQSVGGKLN